MIAGLMDHPFGGRDLGWAARWILAVGSELEAVAHADDPPVVLVFAVLAEEQQGRVVQLAGGVKGRLRPLALHHGHAEPLELGMTGRRHTGRVRVEEAGLRGLLGYVEAAIPGADGSRGEANRRVGRFDPQL